MSANRRSNKSDIDGHADRQNFLRARITAGRPLIQLTLHVIPFTHRLTLKLMHDSASGLVNMLAQYLFNYFFIYTSNNEMCVVFGYRFFMFQVHICASSIYLVIFGR